MADTTKVKEVEIIERWGQGWATEYSVDGGKNWWTKEQFKAIQALIDKYTRESLINTLEDLKRTDWVDRDTTEPTNSNNKEK